MVKRLTSEKVLAILEEELSSDEEDNISVDEQSLDSDSDNTLNYPDHVPVETEKEIEDVILQIEQLQNEQPPEELPPTEQPADEPSQSEQPQSTKHKHLKKTKSVRHPKKQRMIKKSAQIQKDKVTVEQPTTREPSVVQEHNTADPTIVQFEDIDGLEKEYNETNSPIIQFKIDNVYGKNGFEWKSKTTLHKQSKTPSRNVVRVQPGPTSNCRNVTEPSKCFDLFFTDEIWNIILVYTNEEIAVRREKYSSINQNKSTFADVTQEELRALISLLILAAALKSNHLSTVTLFNISLNGSRFVSTMSERRFNFLINCLRFDDKLTRDDRKKTTTFAPIAELWDMLVGKCRENYTPGSYVTIDEQLIGFRGNCPFRMYIPSKPDKYGLKLVMLCDNSTKYMIDATPYLGKGTVPSKTPAAKFFVQTLTKTIANSNRNVTMDNWFSSVPLTQSLLKEDRLTMIGTIKKNKREFPAEFSKVTFQDRKVHSSLFLYHEDMTALSYKTKPNKVVLLVSSLHLDGIVDRNHRNSLPEIISNYNRTKGAVDTFDQMCHHMNCGRKTKRWPMCFFYNMLNIVCINSFIIHVHNSCKQADKPMNRFNYMVALHSELARKFQMSRLSIVTLPTSLKQQIEKDLGSESEPAVCSKKLVNYVAREYCSFCSYIKRRKTSTTCTKCNSRICGEHMEKICTNCATSLV